MQKDRSFCSGELRYQIEEQIREGYLLISSHCNILEDRKVSGVEKLKRRIQAELINLEQLKVNEKELPKHINGCNLKHFKALCGLAVRYDVCEVLAPYRRPDGSITTVDIVADNGNTWVKAIARNVKGLHLSFTGESYSKEKNVTRQAFDYLCAAGNNHHHYKPPKIIFEFTAGITEPVRQKLVKFGVLVKGDIVPASSVFNMRSPYAYASHSDSDSSSCADSDDGETKDSFEASPLNSHLNCKTVNSGLLTVLHNENLSINLDITALFAFVSNLTNGYANFRFKSPMLDEQADRERTNPVMPVLKRAIEGRRLICCKTAMESFNSILDTVGGEPEKERANQLLKKIELVEDGMSSTMQKLRMGGKVKTRSMIIFSSGEFHRAITLTANKSFVNAAESQKDVNVKINLKFCGDLTTIQAIKAIKAFSFKFAVILHESRALSEQKQNSARPIN